LAKISSTLIKGGRREVRQSYQKKPRIGIGKSAEVRYAGKATIVS